MKRVEKALARLMSDIAGKRVLEPACGCAEFSIAAARYAKEVVCFDLDDKRLNSAALHMQNLWFEIMDATQMDYKDSSFDTVVLYNAIGHLTQIAKSVLQECRRVAGKQGAVWIVSSFRMDKAIIRETIIPLIEQMGLSFEEGAFEDFAYIRIGNRAE